MTERTFDAYSYQILENKQRFISQINKGELTVREASDIDEVTLSYAEIKAITSANPLIKKKMELESEVSHLRVLETQYRNNRYHLQDRLAKHLPELIAITKQRITDFELDIALRNSHISKNELQYNASKIDSDNADNLLEIANNVEQKAEKNNKNFAITIAGKTYNQKKEKTQKSK